MSNLVHAYLALVGSGKSLGVVLSQACGRHPADAVFTMNHRSVLSLMALRSVATPEQASSGTSKGVFGIISKGVFSELCRIRLNTLLSTLERLLNTLDHSAMLIPRVGISQNQKPS